MTQPTILITGASEGLGYALANTLILRGAAIGLCARRSEPLRRAVRTLETHGPVLGLQGDITDPQFRARFVGEVVGAFGRIDAMVINASTLGDLPMPSVLETTLENLRSVYETNTFATVDLVQKTIPLLHQQPRSLVIGISSDAAIGGYEKWGVYGSSKAATDLILRTLATEVDGSGTAVYAVDPGDMATSLHEAADPGAADLADPRDVAAAMLPLFEPLFSAGAMSIPFPTGSRLAVVPPELEVR